MSRSAAGARQAILFAGGDAPPALDRIAGLLPLPADTLVVCADRGLVHCHAAGLSPHRLVGDFDSVPPDLLQAAERAGAQRQAYPVDKDASDLAIALDGLCADGVDSVMVLGVSGGRTDHLLFNWQLCAARDWPFALRLVDETVDALRVSATRPATLTVDVGDTVSLLPLERCSGVTTEGLRWPLRDRELIVGGTLGLSNRAERTRCSISVSSGTLLAMRVR